MKKIFTALFTASLIFTAALNAQEVPAGASPEFAADPTVQEIYARLAADKERYGRRALKPREIVKRKAEWNETLGLVQKYFRQHSLWNFAYNPRVTEGKFDMQRETQDFSFNYEFQVDNDRYSLLYDVNKQFHTADIISGDGMTPFETKDYGNSKAWIMDIFSFKRASPVDFTIEASLVDETGAVVASGRLKDLYQRANKITDEQGYGTIELGNIWNIFGTTYNELIVFVNPCSLIVPKWGTDEFKFRDVPAAKIEGEVSIRIDAILPGYDDYFGTIDIREGGLGYWRKDGIWTIAPAVHNGAAVFNCNSKKRETIPAAIDGRPVTVIAGGFGSKYSNKIPDTVEAIYLQHGNGRPPRYFDYSKEGVVKLPASIKYIGCWTFSDVGATGIEFPAETKRDIIIEEAAFTDNNIKRVSIPGSVDMIGRTAFGPIAGVDLAEGLRYVGRTAFGNRRDRPDLHRLTMKKIVIPASVLYIGELAFGDRLTSIEFKGSSYTCTTDGEVFFAMRREPFDRTITLKLPDGFDAETLGYLFGHGFTVKDEYMASGEKACSIKIKVGTGVDLTEK